MRRAAKIERDVCRDFSRSSKLEWLATNGTGGFAMGTVAGVNTRRYHGLLVASLKPPAERYVLLSRVEEDVLMEGQGSRHVYPLGACQYPGVVTPRGFEWLEEFHTDPCPSWVYRLGHDGPFEELARTTEPGAADQTGSLHRLGGRAGPVRAFEELARTTEPRSGETPRVHASLESLAAPVRASIEKQVYLIEGRQAVVIRYRSDREATLHVRPFLAYRGYHSLASARSDPYGNLPPLDFAHDGRFEPDPQWYYNVEYLVELDRGLDFREDLFSPGTIVLDLEPGEWSAILASIPAAGETSATALPVPDPVAKDESLGDSPFVVRRADGRPTIVAGYPWFTDWGRDAMISLPGLLILPGRVDEARAVIEGFLDHLNQGIIPNRFPDAGETPEYNTADATLWMFQAMRSWLAAGADRTFLRDRFYPAAKEIIEWHRRGTWYGIEVDPEDHLLKAGTPGTQLTWMDARIGNWVVTPRNGKPVEINALWYGALCLAADWAAELGDLAAATGFRVEARLVRGAFRAKFWNADRQCLFDVLNEHGPVRTLRPNQIFAVSLPHPLLEKQEQQAVVRMVERELLTPVGLRTLERGDPAYQPRYEGSPQQRDAAYHQGTVWPWLLGPFVDAYLTAFGKTPESLSHCRALVDGLEARTGPARPSELAGTLSVSAERGSVVRVGSSEEQAGLAGCFDSIAEVYDGDEPRRPGGCPAQAWSVAEMARVRAQYGWQ